MSPHRRCLAVLAATGCFALAVVNLTPGRHAKATGKKNDEPKKMGGRVDLHGDPLPERAIGRLGTVRFRMGDSVVAVALSPDGKVLAAAGKSGMVYLLDGATGRERRQFKAGSVDHILLAFSPDGRALACGGNQETISVMDPATGKSLRQFKKAPTLLTSLALSAKGQVLAAGYQGRFVHVFDVAAGKQLRRFEKLPCDLVQVAVSPDGKRLTTWGVSLSRGKGRPARSPALQLWEMRTGEEIRHIDVDLPLANAAFSPDGKILAAGLGYSTVALWESTTGKQIRRVVGRHGTGFRLSFSPDGKTLAGGSLDGAVQLWETATGKRLGLSLGPKGGLATLVFAGPKQILACLTREHSVTVWKVLGEKSSSPREGHSSSVAGLAFSQDGRKIVSVSSDDAVLHWGTRSYKPLRRLQVRSLELTEEEDNDEQPSRFTVPLHTFFVISPDAKKLVTGDEDRSPCLWDLSTGEETCDFETGSTEKFGGFAPKGNMLATCGSRSLIIWKVDPGEELRRFHGPWNTVRCVAFSPNGKTLAAAWSDADSADNEPGNDDEDEGGGTSQCHILLWDMSSGKKLRKLTVRDSLLHSMAFSPDGKILATGARQAVHLWDTATGRPYPDLKEKDFEVTCPVKFSLDGRTLAAGTHDPGTNESAVTVWEVASAQRRCQFTGHRGRVTALTYSPDGTVLASGSEDTTVLLWDPTGATWIELPGRGEIPAKATEKLWSDLAGSRAEAVFPAIVKLAAAPNNTVPFLPKHLRPAQREGAAKATIDRLIAQLNDDQYKVRKQAARNLEKLGDQAEPALRKAFENKPSPELRRQLEGLIVKLGTLRVPHDLLRPLRAVEVLERMATPEGRQLLQALAKGTPDSRLTHEARTALERLAKRSPVQSRKDR
jgi:WD40 repeat protein